MVKKNGILNIYWICTGDPERQIWSSTLDWIEVRIQLHANPITSLPTNPFCSAPRAFWPYAACRNPFQQKRALISQMQNCSILSEGTFDLESDRSEKSGRHDPRHCRKGRIVSTSGVSIHYTRQRIVRSQPMGFSFSIQLKLMD